jgi:serine/threonine-protein kinase
MLGSGGMGNVWLVTHLELGSERALKVIRRAMGLDPAIRARFAREARVMARFSHPNAVTIHDARLEGADALIEMEYVAGKNLSELLTTGVAQPVDWTWRILEQLCNVLDAAHQIGIVHRDLKPRNLMLVDGRPPGQELLKVLDFGLVKILGTELPDELTSPGVFLGTALYASPEQIQDADLDARSDIYSVGVILYELLTGHRPFQGSSSKLVYQQVNVRPPAFHDVNPDVHVPDKVEELVLRCLAKDPADRPQSARALAVEFRDCARTILGSPFSPDGTLEAAPKMMRSSSLLLILAFNVIALLAGALITYWFLRR